jgi:hypothetical protein
METLPKEFEILKAKIGSKGIWLEFDVKNSYFLC